MVAVIPEIVPVKVGEAKFAFKLKPGTEGDVAVPPKSPANCILPVAELVASGVAPAETTALATKAVVANAVVFVPDVCVIPIVPAGKVGVPVKVGEAKFAFKLKPGTEGDVAVPPKSPANCILPVAELVASGTEPEAITCAST